MHSAGVLPEDAPDPRIAWAEQLRLLPIQVMGLAPQPSLEDTDSVGLNHSRDSTGYTEMFASLSYTLWRNPDDMSDAINLVELDDLTRRSIEQVPPWPRPPWLIEQVERMRYPQLGDAVRTIWDRDASVAPPPTRRLIEHVEHVLTNQFRRELGLGDEVGVDGRSSGSFWGQIPEAAVNDAVTVMVDEIECPAVELDTDPFVYGTAVRLVNGGIATAVIPRAELQYVRIEFVTRQHPSLRSRRS